MAEETFGVSLEQHLANRAGLDTTPAAQGGWQKYIGGPTNQLMQAGVPVNDILKKMGMTFEDVSKGIVDSTEFIQTFIDVIP